MAFSKCYLILRFNSSFSEHTILNEDGMLQNYYLDWMLIRLCGLSFELLTPYLAGKKLSKGSTQRMKSNFNLTCLKPIIL